MNSKELFGTFIRETRINRNISLRRFAELLDISPVYLCNIEKGKCSVPKSEVLFRMIELLGLHDDEICDFFDFAAMSKSSPAAPLDLCDYIMDKEIVRTALRTAKDLGASKEEWQEFIDEIKEHSTKNNT